MNDKTVFIFDMDGVLLDSEPHWRTAQIELLSEFGYTITEQECIQNTMGKRIEDISQFWITRFNLPVEPSKFSDSLLYNTASLIGRNASARTGLFSLIEFLKDKDFRIALATSSSKPIISAVIDKLNLGDVFEVALSADEVEYGKPAPDVYLEVCRQLAVSPDNAFALEDSLTGVKAAVSAKITTIAIPETLTHKFEIADYIVSELEEVVTVVADYI